MPTFTGDGATWIAKVITGLLSLVGAVLVSAFFVGREHAQAEYRWIEHYGNGKRANMKWWNAFEPRVWDFHSWFWNWSAPIGVIFGFIFFKE